LVITKNEDKVILRKIKNALLKIFEDFDNEKQIKDLGNSSSGPTYESACRDILEQLRSEIKANSYIYKEELMGLETKLKDPLNHSEHEYRHIYGTYWLLTDSMRAMSKENECKVLTKDEDFRANHMQVKNFLFNHTSPDQLKKLSRA